MSNPLTGSYDAVLQVSRGTVNRLLATLHQNAGTDRRTPTVPHTVRGRVDVGDLRGDVTCQVGVPRITLLDRSTDRFRMAFAIRARFLADPDSGPLGEHIQGTVTVEYVAEGMDPTCPGWALASDDHLWIRVVEGTVAFDGTVVDDGPVGGFGAGSLFPEEQRAQVTRILEFLLAHDLAATPHRLSSSFRPGAMRTLNKEGFGSAVAVPIGLDGRPPLGALEGIDRIFLDGRDVAVAVSKDAIVERFAAALRRLQATFALEVRLRWVVDIWIGDLVDVDITWAVRITSTRVEWQGEAIGLDGALVRLIVEGAARTQESQYDWTFTVVQYARIFFDVDAEAFVVESYGGPAVQVQYDGDYADQINPLAKPEVERAIAAQVPSLTGAGTIDLGPGRRQLTEQLRSLDDNASVAFDQVEVAPDGIVVRGSIGLSGRRSPKLLLSRSVTKDSFTALASWFPGGRIDEYRWSWRFVDGSIAGGQATHRDRFILKAPPAAAGGGAITPWGFPLALHGPLPGIDGSGTLCLQIAGKQVDATTGELVDVVTAVSCDRWDVILIGLGTGTTGGLGSPGSFIPAGIDPWTIAPRLLVRDRGADDGVDAPDEQVLYELGGTTSRTDPTNVLVLRVDGDWDADLAATVREGLAGSGRRDAGLLVQVLVPEGIVGDKGRAALAEVHDGLRDLGAHVRVIEDVGGAWTASLGLPATDEKATWALVTPSGGVSWAHHGALGGDRLASVLDGHLVPAGPPQFGRVGSPVVSDVAIPPWALRPGAGGCPPPPMGRLLKRSVLTFVQPGSASSRRNLERIATDLAPEGAGVFTAVVVDGPDAAEDDTRATGIAADAAVIADRAGAIARRFGVRQWPTTLLVDEDGAVVQVLVGATDHHAPPGPVRRVVRSEPAEPTGDPS